MGINISHKSQQLPLINQRGRRICVSKYVFHLCIYVLSISLSKLCCLWLPTHAISVSTYTRTHSLFLSLSLPYLAYLSPL